MLMTQRHLTLGLFAGILLLISCSSNSSDNSQTTSTEISTTSGQSKEQGVSPIIEIKKIIGKTLTDVEKVLGKAESTEKVKGYPCKNTNCQRAFFKNGSYEIIFKKSKADRITINNVTDLTSNDNAIQALGLPASNPSIKNPNNVIRWNNVDGINEISFFTDYTLIQVTKPE